MGRAISLFIRKQIIEDCSKGIPQKDIASKYGVSTRSIRKLYNRYQTKGTASLVNKYANCGTNNLKFDYLIYRSICWLKYLHRNWGATFILQRIGARHGTKYALPSARTAQTWFKQKGYNQRKTNHYTPKFPREKANFVHHVWQIDAKEKIKIGDGSYVCWLTITDEYSCAILEAPVFPPKANINLTTSNCATKHD